MDRPARKSIPFRVRLAVMIRQRGACAYSGTPFEEDHALAGLIEFDHRPPLSERPIRIYDMSEGITVPSWGPWYWDRGITVQGKPLPLHGADYDPPQHDPAHIFAVLKDAHDTVTHGPGGEKRITTRGSDTGERARGKGLAESHAAHQDYMENRTPGQKRPASTKWPRRWSPPKR